MDNGYLVLDQGGFSSRAAVFDAQGRLVDLVAEPLVSQSPKPHWVEQVPDAVVASLHRCLQRLSESLGARVSQIRCAALVTQRSSIVCWNRRSGVALSPVLSWQDRRAADWLRRAGLDADWVRAKTGLFPNAHFGASKIHWCLRHLPAVKQAARAGELAIGPLAAFLAFSLLNEQPLAIDACNAARTMLYNIERGQWDADLLNRFAVAQEILPEIRPNTGPWGTLRCGDHTVPLMLINGDQCCAFAGLAAGRPNHAVINAGTGAFIALPLPGRAKAPARLLQSLIFDDGVQRRFVAEGTVNGAGSALEWIEREVACSLDTLLPDGEIPVFLNGVGGLGSPYWQADFSSRFVGRGSAAAQVRAVLESIVFLLKRNLEELENIAIPDQLVVSGGVANRDIFCQALADVTRLPVVRPVITEATARGAAWELAGRPKWQMAETVFAPQADVHNITTRYTVWRGEMEHLIKPA